MYRSNCPILIPYHDGSTHLGISKKSKFASRVNEFKSAVLSKDYYESIMRNDFTSADQHS